MAALRVTLETEGGFAAIPGLRRAVAVDAATLPDHARREFEALVAGVRHGAAPPKPAAGARDARTYTLTIHGDAGRRTVRFADSAGDGPARALRDFVARHGTPTSAPGRAP